MSNVVTSLFAIAMIMGAVLVLTRDSLSSADRLSLTWQQKLQRTGDRERSELSLIAADLVATSTSVDVSIRNSGQTTLRDFAHWDVVMRYYATSSNSGLRIVWLPYTTTTPPASEKWTVQGIYIDAAALKSEAYDPNVFNPGEEMIVRINITPVIPTSTDNLIMIGETHGVTLAAPFSR